MLAILDSVRDICTNTGTNIAFDFVLENNPSNNLPYHNLLHTLSMVECCFDAASHYNLPLTSVRRLCVAALFHDYDHTGGAELDSVNINRAIDGFKHQHCLIGHDLFGSRDTTIERIIAVTEYPYVLKPHCIEEKIIRDADLLSVIYDDWYDRIIIGLGKEMSVKYKREVTELEMVRGQIEFLKNVTMFTDWGYKTFHSVYTNRMTFLHKRATELTPQE